MEISNLSSTFDVIIVGSGPSGSTAAFKLAENGYKVLILEKVILPRYKTCGGGIVGRIKNILPFEFDEVIEKKCYSAIVFDHQSGLKFLTKRNEPIIMMTMRNNFDDFLLSKAKSIGVIVKDKCEVINITENEDGIEIKTQNETFNCKFLIGSDGANGIVSKKINSRENLLKLPALEYEVYVDQNNFDKFSDKARFDFGIIKNGYAWVFPKKDHLSIGIISMKKSEDKLKDILDNYFKILGINNIIKIEKHGFFIPIANNRKKVADNRILLTGDSAGIADPVTAEGISNAIYSGLLAAEALIYNKLDKESVATYYNKIIFTKIFYENKYSNIIAKLVYRYPKVRFLLFRFYGQRLSEVITDIFIGKNKYSSLLKSPSNYLKLIKYFFSSM